MLTIFTPTYNRASTLPTLFDSLRRQTCHDFEWLIVDDGSTDDTAAVVERFRDENPPFEIRYIKKVNGGKHTAINLGAKEARGDWFFIVDSDDRLMEDAVEWFYREAKAIADDPQYAALVGSRIDTKGGRLGFEQPYTQIDCDPVTFCFKHGGGGDHAEIVKTDILRRHPFPEYPDERFCAEGLVWHRIGREHLFRYIDHPIYVTEYLPDGLTRNVRSLKLRDPRYSRLIDLERARNRKIPLKHRLKSAISFWRYTFALREKQPKGAKTAVSESIKMFPASLFLGLFGYILFQKSKK